MCGRFAGLTYDEVVHVIAEMRQGMTPRVMPDWPDQRAEARPCSMAWVMQPDGARGPRGTSCGFTAREAQWGFPIEWSARPAFNTRIETATSAHPGMWRGAVENGRCIVPCIRFYEPHATETAPSPVSGRLVKRQYAFSMPDGEVLLMAAVMERGWFSIVTTQPNGSVAGVHDRMPLVLRAEEARAWLGPDFAALADRSGVALRAYAEPVPESPQLSLF